MRKLLVILLLLSFNTFSNEKFDWAVGHLITFEGKKLDKSIGTLHSKYGVTKPTLKRYNPNLKLEDLTESQAKEIMKKFYWDEYNLDQFIDKRNALLVLDFIYNSNPTNAIKVMQKSLGNKVTGKLSISDVADINYLGYNGFYEKYSVARLGYMKSLKVWKKYEKGWTARVLKLGKGLDGI